MFRRIVCGPPLDLGQFVSPKIKRIIFVDNPSHRMRNNAGVSVEIQKVEIFPLFVRWRPV